MSRSFEKKNMIVGMHVKKLGVQQISSNPQCSTMNPSSFFSPTQSTKFDPAVLPMLTHPLRKIRTERNGLDNTKSQKIMEKSSKHVWKNAGKDQG